MRDQLANAQAHVEQHRGVTDATIVALHRSEAANQRQREEVKQLGTAGIAREAVVLGGRREVQQLEQISAEQQRSRAELTSELIAAKQAVSSQGSATSADAQMVTEMQKLQAGMLSQQTSGSKRRRASSCS